MRRLVGVSAVAVGLALTGCENSVDPPAEDTSAAAQETAAAGDGDATSDTGSSDAGADTGASDADATGTGGSGTDATDTTATDTTATDPGATDGSMITDEVMNRVEEQFPAMAAVVPRDQLRALVSDVCGAVGSGDVATAQQEMQQRFGVDTGTSEQVVSFLEREVCTA